MGSSADLQILSDLTPAAEKLLERHLSTTKEWFPHEQVPWSRGRDYEPGQDWDPTEVDLPDEVRSALFVNLLTEDNLPYYFRDIERMFGRDGAWGEWVRRWTAEEGRHGIVIHDYLMVTRSIDPVELERGRMAQVSRGEVPEPETALDGMTYVALQELATRISHFNTGQHLQDEAGRKVMRRVAADENLHFLFYRDLVAAAIEIDPSGVVMAIERQVSNFAMPGTGIPNFSRHARAIANAGIYDLQIHHDQILQAVVVRDWGLFELEGLSPQAEQARERTAKAIERTGRLGERLVARRERHKAMDAEPTPEPVQI